MNIDINPSENPDAGIINGQRVEPGQRIENVQDDLLREAAMPSGATRPSESTLDDSPESLSD
jgi:hypothetical protein